MPQLLDHRGLPIRTGDLTREIAQPSVIGLRGYWSDNARGALTPGKLVAMQDAALEGDWHEYLTWAIALRRRDLNYRSVLSTRTLAVAGLPVTVEAASDAKEHIEQADLVRTHIINKPGFRRLVNTSLTALNVGFSTSEIVWQKSPKLWWPSFKKLDPRLFALDQDTLSQLLLRTATNPNGEPLPPYKFVTHIPFLDSDSLAANGMAWVTLFWHVALMFDIHQWLAFAEVFGMPLRLGRYNKSASPEDIAILRQAVQNLGSDAAATLPDSMRIEFQDIGTATGGDNLFMALADWIKNLITLLVLGQTRSTNEQSTGLHKASESGGRDQVRQDILVSDALDLEETLQRDVVEPFIALNLGPQEAYPRIRLYIPESRDLQGMTNMLQVLVPMGLRVEASVIRDFWGIPDPDKDSELLTPPSQPAPAPAMQRQALALNRETTQDAHERQPLEQLAEDMADDWRPVMEPMLEPLLAALQDVRSEADVDRILADAVLQMDLEPQVERMFKMLMMAQIYGRAVPPKEQSDAS